MRSTCFYFCVAVAMIVAACASEDDRSEQPSITATTGPTQLSFTPSVPATLIPGTARPSGNGIYVISPDGSVLRLIKAGVYYSEPSPADNRVALANFCESPTSVTTVDADSGQETVLATFDGIGYGPKWSPDGRYILLPVLSEVNPRTPAVYLVDTAGSQPPLVLFIGASFDWSPDSSEIAFVENSQSDASLRIMSVADRTVSELDTGPSIYGPLWSPDGGRIAYRWAESSQATTFPLVVINRDGSGRTTLSDNAFLHSWSRDGNDLYVVLNTGEQNAPFAIMPADTASPPVVLTKGSANVAPNDASLAVYRHVGQQEREITVFDRRDGSERNVSGTVDPVDLPIFSPSGKELVFGGEEQGYDQSGAKVGTSGWNVYTVAIDGTNLRRLLAPDLTVVNRGWSQDGQWVMFFVGPITGCEEPFGP